MLGVPQGIDKLLALIMGTHDRGCSRSGNEAYAMAQLLEPASLQDLITLRKRAVCTILVNESIDALRIEEILNLLTILLLPFGIGTTPLIIEGYVHRHTPRVVTEVINTIATGLFTLFGFRHTWETGHLHLAAIILAHIAIQARLRIDGLMQELARGLGALVPIIGTTIIGFVIGFIGGLIVGALSAATNSEGIAVVGNILINLLASLISIAICFSYEGYFLSTSGATIGKKVMGLKVLHAGEYPSFLRGGCRYLAKGISFFICMIGYIMACFTQDNKALHDMICDTIVVKG